MSDQVLRDRKGNIKITNPSSGQKKLKYLILGMIIFTIVGFFLMDYKNLDFKYAIEQTLFNLNQMFLHPSINQTSFSNALYQVFITLSLAFLATILGAIISLFLAFGAAVNLSKPWISNIIKGIITIFRAVPTVLWVLIFAISAGLGSIAAVIGMIFHSIAYLVKAFSEAFEEIDPGKIEALSASGASYPHILFQVVVPQSKSFLISWTFLRFEINFGVAVAMGAAAGAGGIGFELIMASSFYYDLNEVGAITIIILIVAIILELIANKLKASA